MAQYSGDRTIDQAQRAVRERITKSVEDIADQARQLPISPAPTGGALKTAAALAPKAATAYLRNKMSRAIKGRDA